MKYIKVSSWFLGVSIFMFGILKFFDPFKSWYQVQINNSGLGNLSYAMGIMGEIVVGFTIISALIFREKLSEVVYKSLLKVAFGMIAFMMIVAVYVHIHINVPAEVLPLKIKAPIIPIFFMAIALTNLGLFSTKNKTS